MTTDTTYAIPRLSGFCVVLKTGTVLGDKIWSESHVSGGGGGIMIQGYGVGKTSTKTEVLNKREFWIQFTDGTEQVFTLDAQKIQVRPGQVVTLVLVKTRRKEVLMNIYNHNTKGASTVTGASDVLMTESFLALGALPAAIMALILAAHGLPWALLLLSGFVWLPKYFKDLFSVVRSVNQGVEQAKAAAQVPARDQSVTQAAEPV